MPKQADILTFRYPGFSAFNSSELHHKLFHGRDTEIEQLLEYIDNSGLAIVSGNRITGKTSLLKAGISKPLIEKQHIPLYIDCNLFQQGIPEFIFHQIEQDLLKTEEKIKYISGSKNSLYEFFQTSEFWSANNALLTPTLILDNFDALFTLYNTKEQKTFTEQITDIINSNFIIKPDELNIIKTSRLNLKIIFSINSTYIANFDEIFGKTPLIFENRIYISELKSEKVKDAINLPALIENEQLSTPKFSYNPKAVDFIIDYIITNQNNNSENISPLTLQWICSSLELKLFNSSSNSSKSIITVDHFKDNYSISNILYDNFVGILKATPNNTKQLKKLFETKFANKSGIATITETEIINKFNIQKEALDFLCNNKLLIKNIKSSIIVYQISSPVLANIIHKKILKHKKSKRKRINQAVLIFSFICVGIIGFILFKHFDEKYFFKKNNLLVSNGNFDKAISNYKAAITDDPDNTNYINHLGNTYRLHGENEKAIEQYLLAIKTDPTYHHAYNNLGNTLYDQGKYQEAHKYYLTAIELKPNNEDYSRNLRNALNKCDTELYKANETSDSDEMSDSKANYHNILGDELILRGEFAEAIKNYEKAARLAPHSTKFRKDLKRAKNIIENVSNQKEIYYKLGILYTKKGKYNDAIVSFENVLELDQSHANSYNYLGFILLQLENYNEAIKMYKKAINIDSQNANSYNNLGYAYLKLNKLYDAYEQFLASADIKADNTWLYRNWACYFAIRKQKDKALDSLQKALDLGYNDYKWLKNEPSLDELRDNIRYKEMVTRVNKH